MFLLKLVLLIDSACNASGTYVMHIKDNTLMIAIKRHGKTRHICLQQATYIPIKEEFELLNNVALSLHHVHDAL